MRCSRAVWAGSRGLKPNTEPKVYLKGWSRSWAGHRGDIPVPWQHCSPSLAMCVCQQGAAVRVGAHLRLMNSNRERLSVCWDLGLSWLSISSLFLLALSFPLTTWGHTRGCHCSHRATASPALAFSLPKHDTEQPRLAISVVSICALCPHHRVPSEADSIQTHSHAAEELSHLS